MKPSPIVLFIYNRLTLTQQTVEALKKNELAEQSDLVIYSDGPKGPQDQAKVDDVRKYIHSIDGFNSVKIIEWPVSKGLADSIIAGVTEVVNKYGRIIVLEDDLLTSPFFLRFMNDALEFYEYQEKAISIHGYTYPVQKKLPETFFICGADCWGWATWKRGWDLFEKDGKKLLEELKQKKLTKQFDFNGAYRFTRMLKQQIAGKNDSWAIRWHASAFLQERLTLYPGCSLIRHVGKEGEGTHFGNSDALDVELTQQPIPVEQIDIIENSEARRIVENYLRSVKTSFASAILNYSKNTFMNIVKGSQQW